MCRCPPSFRPAPARREKAAVRGLTLSIARGECFGLLGPNGAGKSTTLNCLTGSLEPSSGTAVVDGFDIRRDLGAIYTRMGVCPQDNLLWEALTAREHLLFYGRLKNLRGAELAAAADAALRSVNLLNGGTGEKQVRTYSGGMKRRLSVAISLIGSPSIVYMDEPSTVSPLVPSLALCGGSGAQCLCVLWAARRGCWAWWLASASR